LSGLCDPGLDPVAQNVALERGEDHEHARQGAALAVVRSSASERETKPTPAHCLLSCCK
jgi:hypothetical protein